MLGGPTVRRIHREREYGLRPSRLIAGQRSRSHVTRVRLPDRPPRTTPRPLLPTQVKWEERPPCPFPCNISAVLGLDRYPGLVVLDGRLGQVLRGLSRPSGPSVVLAGARWQIGFGESLRERLMRAFRLHLPGLMHWAGAQQGEGMYARLDNLPGDANPNSDHQVGTFIHDRLIPHLRYLIPAPREKGISVSVLVDALMARFEPRFAFLEDRWYGLIPFFGKPEPLQPEFNVGRDQYLGLEAEPVSKALERYDAALQVVVRDVFSEGSFFQGKEGLFRSDIYTVIRTPGGRYYICQQVPPYVVEGEDRKLYYFDGVEIGIHLTSLDPRRVIQPVCVRVLQEYRHMFVGGYGGGSFICMPRGRAYFDELHQLPLEEALVRHLESARMTLCGGYMPFNSAHHPIRILNRPMLSEREARKRGLPIYWYYSQRQKMGMGKEMPV